MRLPLIALTVAALLCSRADATAFAGVKLAFWHAEFAYYFDPASDMALATLPPGVILECAGDAAPVGTACGDQRGVSVISNGALASGLVDALGGFTLYNTGISDYRGSFVFRTVFSSFNPAGPDVGARVDDPAHEFASFFSVVSGPGVFDLHGCSMNHGAAPHAAAMAAACSVPSPDVSQGQAALGPLLAGQTLSAAYQIYIQVIAQGDGPVPAPEPLTLGVFLAGLFVVRRFRVA